MRATKTGVRSTDRAGDEDVNVDDPLTAAVLGVLCHADAKGWNHSPQLYALAWDPSAEQGDAAPGSLVPYEQDPLPEGEPADVLATIHWSDKVDGCALVTEVVVLPPGATDNAPRGRAEAEQWAAKRKDAREARLAVGVLRDGKYMCCLQLRHPEEVLVGAELADDLVADLLGTL